MSEENVEIVRSIYAAWERGDFTSAEWAHPEHLEPVSAGVSPCRRIPTPRRRTQAIVPSRSARGARLAAERLVPARQARTDQRPPSARNESLRVTGGMNAHTRGLSADPARREQTQRLPARLGRWPLRVHAKSARQRTRRGALPTTPADDRARLRPREIQPRHRSLSATRQSGCPDRMAPDHRPTASRAAARSR